MKKLAALLIIAIFIVSYTAHFYLHNKKTLYVYMWSDYIQPELIEQFQKEYNCWVVVDTYDSNEAMYTKLLLGASGYDIVFPSNYFLDLMSKRGMLHEIDSSLLSNFRYIDTPFLEKKIKRKPTKYGIPYMMTFSGIAWRNDKVAPLSLQWDLFSDPTYTGRTTLLNDMRETMGIALKSLGYSANTIDKNQIAAAKQHIITSWRPNIAKFESEQYKNGIANGEYLLVHGYNGDCLQVMRDNAQVTFSYPIQGSLVAVDYAAIMASSCEVSLAHTFLNYVLDPHVSAQNMAFTCTRAPNMEARKYLPKDLAQSIVLYPEDDPNISFECLESVDEAQKDYIEAWDDIKTGRATKEKV